MFYVYISYTWYLPTYICIYIYIFINISIHDICVTIIHMSQSVVTCHPTFIIQATNRWCLSSSLKWTASILSFKHFGDEVQKCWAVAAHCRGMRFGTLSEIHQKTDRKSASSYLSHYDFGFVRRFLCLWPNMNSKWFQQSTHVNVHRKNDRWPTLG